MPGLLLGAVTVLVCAGCSILFPSSNTGGGSAPPPTTTETVTATSTPAPEITPEELVDAPIPSLCDHPAGTMSNGELLSRKKGYGGAWIAAYEGDWKELSFRSWRDEQGEPLAALVMDCNQGGVGWPPHVVFYTSGPTVLGEIDVSDVVGDGRQSVVKLEPATDGVRLSMVNTYQEGDGGCCGTLSVVADFFWDGAKAGGRMVDRLTEQPTAKQAFAAALAGDRAAIEELFNKDGRAEALAFKKAVTKPDPDDWSSRVDCVAATDDETFAGEDRDYARVCYFHTKAGFAEAAVAMKWVGFDSWEAAGIRFSAG